MFAKPILKDVHPSIRTQTLCLQLTFSLFGLSKKIACCPVAFPQTTIVIGPLRPEQLYLTSFPFGGHGLKGSPLSSTLQIWASLLSNHWWTTHHASGKNNGVSIHGIHAYVSPCILVVEEAMPHAIFGWSATRYNIHSEGLLFCLYIAMAKMITEKCS